MSRLVCPKFCLWHISPFLMVDKRDNKFMRSFWQFVHRYQLFWELEKIYAYCIRWVTKYITAVKTQLTLSAGRLLAILTWLCSQLSSYFLYHVPHWGRSEIQTRRHHKNWRRLPHEKNSRSHEKNELLKPRARISFQWIQSFLFFLLHNWVPRDHRPVLSNLLQLLELLEQKKTCHSKQ